MTSKRKRDGGEQPERRGKRRRRRANSEPLLADPDSAVKRQALNRLFGRICSTEERREEPAPDENEDPLLDCVPVDMDPEQLGFLVCAQETLRFLAARGVPVQHPVFARLRSRLLRGIDELAVA